MRTVTIEEAKTHLSELVEQAAGGEPFVIEEAGKPRVKVVAVDAPKLVRRIGFMEGEFTIPEDFKAFGREEIEQMFYGDEE